MKIILMANTDWFLYNFCLNIADKIKQRGHDLLFVSPPGKYISRLVENGYSWKSIDVSRRSLNPVSEILNIFELFRFYKKEKPDIVMHYTIKPVIYGSFISSLLGIPTINTITGLGSVFSDMNDNSMLRNFVKLLYKVALRNTQVVFINEDDQNCFLSLGLTKQMNSHLIPSSGIDFQHFVVKPLTHDVINILFVGRLLKDKGIYDFVEVARTIKLRPKSKKLSFVLVGCVDSGNPSSVTEDEIYKWEDEGIIDYWGWQEDMLLVYEKANIICLPSYREGLPRSLLEAAGCGRPIIATNVPGCRQVVTHGKTGLLIPPKDIEAFVRAVEDLVNNPEKAEALGRNGRELVIKQFSEEKAVEQTLNLILSIYNN